MVYDLARAARERVRRRLPEHVTHVRARDNQQRPLTHPDLPRHQGHTLIGAGVKVKVDIEAGVAAGEGWNLATALTEQGCWSFTSLPSLKSHQKEGT